MNQQIQPGAHLDADQISVFVEGVATAREREEVLVHLAHCPECRDAVFLMQSSAGLAPVPREAPRRRWWISFGLAGAALAAGFTFLVLLRPHPAARVELQQQAAVKQPAPAAAPAAPILQQSPPDKAAPAAPNLPTARKATGAAIGPLRSAEQPMAPAGPASSPKAAAPATAPIIAAAAPPPALEKPQPPNAGAVVDQNLPISGRSVANLARSANPPALIIEHDRGPDNGASQVNGRVTDASGAVISGAAVTLRDAAGTSRRATTANDGSFDISAVPPGHYELIITARGFETSKQNVDLEARDLAMLDSTLSVGASSETVTVTAAAPLYTTNSAEMSTIVESLPSGLPTTKTVSNGRRALSLDSAGTLFLSHNGGKNWKQIKPPWSGTIVDVSLAAAPEASASAKKSKSTSNSAKPTRFEITTDSGAHWASPDGAHWFAQ